jgi:hypothetical protein
MVDQALQTEREYMNGLSSANEKEKLSTFLESRPSKVYRKLASDMGKEPGYDVPGQTRFRILFESNVVPYTNVIFTDGPFKGQTGWLSRASFSDPRTAMP